MVYDDLNRLAQVTGNNAPSLMFGTASYGYDVLDNLTHVQVTAGAQARNQDAANRLTNANQERRHGQSEPAGSRARRPSWSGSDWDDVIEQARFRKAVQDSIAAADRAEFASEDDVRRAFAKWGVDVTA